MAVTVECPRCTHKQKIDDDRTGQENPCKICHFMIQPAAQPKPAAPSKAKTKLGGATTGNKTKLATDGIKAGTPTQGKKSAPAGSPPTAPPKLGDKKKRTDDDDDDDDRPPPKRRSTSNIKAEQGSSNTMMYAIGGGIAFVLLLVVCGGGLGVVLLFTGLRAGPQIVQNDDPQVFIVNQPNPKPIPIPIPKAEFLDPNNSAAIDRALDLMRGPGANRAPALAWLNATNSNHPRKADVARQLENVFGEYFNQPMQADNFYIIYFRWNTPDNVPSLIRITEDPRTNGFRHQAMKKLAAYKDPRGVPAIARRLENLFDRDEAVQALKAFGSMAQPEVIKFMNHRDTGVRGTVQGLLTGYNTPDNFKISQSIADLNSNDPVRRMPACSFLASIPIDPMRRTEVAQALTRTAVFIRFPFVQQTEYFLAVEKWHTPESIPSLVQMMNAKPIGSQEAMKVLGKIGTPETLKAISKHLGKPGDAFRILKDAGAAAEPAVIEFMNTTMMANARFESARLLGEIGTRNGGSLVALQQITAQYPNDPLLRIRAQAAQKSILARP